MSPSDLFSAQQQAAESKGQKTIDHVLLYCLFPCFVVGVDAFSRLFLPPLRAPGQHISAAVYRGPLTGSQERPPPRLRRRWPRLPIHRHQLGGVRTLSLSQRHFEQPTEDSLGSADELDPIPTNLSAGDLLHFDCTDKTFFQDSGYIPAETTS